MSGTSAASTLTSLIGALESAKSISTFKSALDNVPLTAKYFTPKIRDAILSFDVHAIEAPRQSHSSLAQSLCWFFLHFARECPGPLKTEAVRDRIGYLFEYHDCDGSTAQLGEIVSWITCGDIDTNQAAAKLYSSKEVMMAVLHRFVYLTSASDARFITNALNNILIANDLQAQPVLNGLNFDRYFVSAIPFAKSSPEVTVWFVHCLFAFLNYNSGGQRMFSTQKWILTLQEMQGLNLSSYEDKKAAKWTKEHINRILLLLSPSSGAASAAGASAPAAIESLQARVDKERSLRSSREKELEEARKETASLKLQLQQLERTAQNQRLKDEKTFTERLKTANDDFSVQLARAHQDSIVLKRQLETSEQEKKDLQKKFDDQKLQLDDQKLQLQHHIELVTSQKEQIVRLHELLVPSPFIKDKPYQVDLVANKLSPLSDPNSFGTLISNLPQSSPLFHHVKNGLWRKLGTCLPTPRTVNGFDLKDIDVIHSDVATLEGRMRRLQQLRGQNGNLFNPSSGSFSTEQLQLLVALRDQFLPRPTNAHEKAPNLINVFHGTKFELLPSVVNGLVAVRQTDAGFFGSGVYTTTSIEYAAKYAQGDFDFKDGPYQPRQTDGCFPVVWCVAAVGVCYPLTREVDYSKNRVHHDGMSVSDYFGMPMKPGYDCHCVAVNETASFQAVARKDMQYMEIVFDQEVQVLPIAVLWVKPC